MAETIDFSCRVCGVQCDLAPDPPDRAVCEKHCEDHNYIFIVGIGKTCEHCGAYPPHDWYED